MRIYDRPMIKLLLRIRILSHLPFRFTNCKNYKARYAQNIIVYNLSAHNFVSLKDNPNKVYQIEGNWMNYMKM